MQDIIPFFGGGELWDRLLKQPELEKDSQKAILKEKEKAISDPYKGISWRQEAAEEVWAGHCWDASTRHSSMAESGAAPAILL